jgi:hypothetical protein
MSVHPFQIIERVDVERERAELMRRFASIKLEVQTHPCAELHAELLVIMQRLQRLDEARRA